jgi:hypothetical protein
MDLDVVKIEAFRYLVIGFFLYGAFGAGKVTRGNRLRFNAVDGLKGVIFLAAVAFGFWGVSAGTMEAGERKERVTAGVIVCYVTSLWGLFQKRRTSEEIWAEIKDDKIAAEEIWRHVQAEKSLQKRLNQFP